MKWKAPKIWDSCDCWIIGGGLSISQEFDIPLDFAPDLRNEFYAYGDFLNEIHNERVIGVNLGAFVGDWVDVAYFGDSDTYTEYKSWFDAFGGLKVSSAGKFADKEYKSVKFLQKDLTVGISKNTERISWNCKNSGVSAINLAYHLGAKRILLLGFDFKAGQNRVHFHTGYPDKTKTPTARQRKKGIKAPKRIPDFEVVADTFVRFNENMNQVKKDADALGLEVINLSPESNINVFEKMSVKEFLTLRK